MGNARSELAQRVQLQRLGCLSDRREVLHKEQGFGVEVVANADQLREQRLALRVYLKRAGRGVTAGLPATDVIGKRGIQSFDVDRLAGARQVQQLRARLINRSEQAIFRDTAHPRRHMGDHLLIQFLQRGHLGRRGVGQLLNARHAPGNLLQ